MFVRQELVIQHSLVLWKESPAHDPLAEYFELYPQDWFGEDVCQLIFGRDGLDGDFPISYVLAEVVESE